MYMCCNSDTLAMPLVLFIKTYCKDSDSPLHSSCPVYVWVPQVSSEKQKRNPPACSHGDVIPQVRGQACSVCTQTRAAG